MLCVCLCPCIYILTLPSYLKAKQSRGASIVIEVHLHHPSTSTRLTQRQHSTLPHTQYNCTLDTNMDVDSTSQSNYLESLLSQLPTSLHGQVQQLEVQSSRKLWHQLTNTLQAFLNDPQTNHIQIDLWENFIKNLSKKLDRRRLVEIATTVAGQYQGESVRTFNTGRQAG